MTDADTLTHATARLHSGETTSVELVTNALAAIDEYDEQIGAFLHVFRDRALIEAGAADEGLRAGRPVGALHGVPIAVKDMLTCADAPTTAQSRLRDPGTIEPDATSVARLRAAGAIVIGKTTTMEFAVGTPDRTKPFPVPCNPWRPAAWAGGSSSGSGAAVAVGMALGALGTDTGGSIRMPAAFCGITGLKPTYGLVPRTGCLPLAWTLDHVGPMARSARDCAVLLGVLAGRDAADASSVDRPVADFAVGLTGEIAGLRIGVDPLSRNPAPGADPSAIAAFDKALEVLEALGARVVEIEVPDRARMGDAHALILDAEAFAYHRAALVDRWPEYGRGTRLRVSTGAFYSAADYLQAQRVRAHVTGGVNELFDRVDAIASPTAAIGAMDLVDLGDELGRWMRFIDTGYWDASGHPALSVPMGFTGTGLPVGLQLIGARFDETTVLRVGDAYQSATDWHLRRPLPSTTA